MGPIDFDPRGPFTAIFIIGIIVGIGSSVIFRSCSSRYDVRIDPVQP